MVRGATAEVSNESTRDYKVWSKHEERTLVMCMLDLTEKRIVENGNFRLPGLKELERMMRELVDNCQLAAIPHIKSKVRYFKDKFTATLELKEASGFGWDDARGCVIAEEGVFAEWVKSHPKAAGLNTKPLPFFDELSKVFGVNHAMGADAVQPSDAASMLEPRVLLSDFMSEQNTVNADSYTFPANLDHDEVMAEIVNQGIDLEATGLKELDVAMSGRKLKGKGQQSATSSGTKRTRAQAFKEDSGRIADTIEVATENIAKIATNYCIEGELAVKRQGLYQELAEFYELSVVDRTRALRHLNRDDGDATTYFQLLTMEEKRTFVSILLE
ncbi:hypothetical protein LINPERPRIM_LOCUS32012 [Linum perenne]